MGGAGAGETGGADGEAGEVGEAAGVFRRGEDFPLLLEVAEKVSAGGQREARLTVRSELLLTIVGAASGVVSWRVGAGRLDVWAGVGTLAFLLAATISVVHASRNPEARWYRGRAAAESVKTLTWLYAVGGQPFAADDDQADDRLLSRFRELIDSLKELDQVALSNGTQGFRQQVTAAMRHLRARPVDERRHAYLESRINQQITWYSGRARQHSRKARRWMTIAAAANLCGALAGLLRVINVLQIDLLGIAAAVASATTAWTQLLQHRTLANSYAVAVQDLVLIRDRLPLVDDASWPRFVADAEDAISREHTMWLARRGLAAGPGNLRER